ncbi:MAG TPA: lytic polysaccharide monooxygenase [Arsenophonus sp.]
MSRAAFELKSFCSQFDHGSMPKAEVSITCKLLEDRTGYHVIYGVWKIADIRNSFYQEVDVNLAAKTEHYTTHGTCYQPTY